MRVRLLYGVALALAGIPASAQMPPNIANAPFTAVRTSTTTHADVTNTTVGIIARRSDGSTYVELKTPAGKGEVLIFDVAHHRTIELYLADHFYTVSPSPNLQAETRAAEYVQHYLKSSGEPGFKRRNGDWEITTLSQRKVGDVAAVGFSEQRVDGRKFEHWYSPVLDMNVETQQHDPSQGIDAKMQMQDIRLVEPDDRLFQIPPGYVEYRQTPNGPRPIAP
jgi:hypothetical protein